MTREHVSSPSGAVSVASMTVTGRGGSEPWRLGG